MSDLVQKQREYYAKTADAYEQTHVKDDDEHGLALKFMVAIMRSYGLKTVLDVGCGTGRTLRGLAGTEFEAVGIEPVQELIDQGIRRGLPPDSMRCASGDAIPYPDNSFDVVCEFGVLHHVRKPETVVSEMTRVARKAIFLSDTNRFGRASLTARLIKFASWKLGIWPFVYFFWTRGKQCDITDCDGIAYSYSVYDSYDQLAAWADRIIAIPTKVEGTPRKSWFHPLFTSSHVLLCAIREDVETAKPSDHSHSS